MAGKSAEVGELLGRAGRWTGGRSEDGVQAHQVRHKAATARFRLEFLKFLYFNFRLRM